jgi:hypothetical protein
VSLHDDPSGTKEPHTRTWVGLEWAGRYLSYGARPFLSLDHHDRSWRCLDRYFFYRGEYVDIVSGQQVRWSQVFQLEDPGEEDPICMQGTVSRGQSSAVSAGGSSAEVSIGPKDCRIEQFIDQQGRVDHCMGKLF